MDFGHSLLLLHDVEWNLYVFHAQCATSQFVLISRLCCVMSGFTGIIVFAVVWMFALIMIFKLLGCV